MTNQQKLFGLSTGTVIVFAVALTFVFSQTLYAQPPGIPTGPPGAPTGMEMSNKDTKKDRSGGFADLLETKDLSQFRGYKSEEIPTGWSLQGNNLVFDGKGNDDVITRETYRDFELHVEWSISEGGNSGIMFRVGLGDDQPYLTGPEIQILDDEKHGDGVSELTSAGALYGLYPAENKRLKPTGQWNKSRIVVEGNKVSHRLNGYLAFEAEMGSDDWNQRLSNSKFSNWPKFNSLEEGHIAFQNHGDEVKFRNIRIKRLGEEDADSDAGTADAAAGAAPGQTANPTINPGVNQGNLQPPSRSTRQGATQENRSNRGGRGG